MASDDDVMPNGKDGRGTTPPEQLLADVITAIQAGLQKLGYPEEQKFPRAPIL
jgi:hypothetical protein